MIRVVVYPYLPSDPGTKWIVALRDEPQMPLFEAKNLHDAITWALDDFTKKVGEAVLTDVVKLPLDKQKAS
jgi:hypothetical protein